jgi:NAD(P)-dependent dehydrogenase (short-subunit alcohol dehydrogenase family)
MAPRLDGKVAIVTGAAHGTGKASARRPGLIGFTRTLDCEVGSDNITVSCVSPGRKPTRDQRVGFFRAP